MKERNKIKKQMQNKLVMVRHSPVCCHPASSHRRRNKIARYVVGENLGLSDFNRNSYVGWGGMFNIYMHIKRRIKWEMKTLSCHMDGTFLVYREK